MIDVMVLGAGARGREHCQALGAVPGLRLAGIVDPSPQARAMSAAAPAYAELDAALAAVAPRIAVVATPPEVRGEIVERLCRVPSLQAILVEKPLALDLSQARRMLAACQARAIRLVAGHQLRYAQEFETLRERAAAVEPLRLVQAECHGNLLDQGSHMVDLIRWVTRREIRWAMAAGTDDLSRLARFAPLPPDLAADRSHPAPRWMVAALGLDGGLVATLHCGLLTAHTRPELGPWLQKRLTLVGEEGLASAHVAGHYRELTRQVQTDQPFSRAEYPACTRRLHEALRDALLGDAPHRCEGEDALRSLEALLACARSAREGGLVVLGEAPAPSVSPTPAERQVSVVLPLADHRGLWAEAVESWTVQHGVDPAEYELVVLLDDATSHLDEGVRARLRPWDSVVRCGPASEMEQYHEGATRAAGEWLLLTEPHCRAEPWCLSQVLAHAARSGEDGFCLRSLPLETGTGRVARAECRMYEAGFSVWSRPESWSKVFLRGVALRRLVYLASGGFRTRYGPFAEWLLAADLRLQGYRLGYAPGAAVEHLYCKSLSALEPMIREFTDGECQFRADRQGPQYGPFFGEPPEWRICRGQDGSLNRAIRRAAWTRVFRGRFRFACRLWRSGLSGPRWQWRRAALATALARWRFRLGWFSPERAQAAFQRWYMGVVARSRIAWCLAHPPEDGGSPGPRFDYSSFELEPPDLYGFHDREESGGRRFRWSSELAAVRLALPPGAYGLSIELGPFRSLSVGRDLEVALDGRPVQELRLDGNLLSGRVDPAAFAQGAHHWLILLARPWKAPNDARPLGLPVVRVQVTPEGGIHSSAAG